MVSNPRTRLLYTSSSVGGLLCIPSISTNAYYHPAWEKLADHEALIADKDAYPKLGAAIGAAKSDGALSLFHLVFKPTPVPEVHFNAPITEFVIQTLREGKTNADLEALVWENPVNADGKAFAVGKKVEVGNQYVLAKGWESIEVRRIRSQLVNAVTDQALYAATQGCRRWRR